MTDCTATPEMRATCERLTADLPEIACPCRQAIRIDLPWSRPPLSQNDRDDRKRGGARKIALAKEEAQWAIRAAKVRPIVGAEVTLHFRVANMRRRDADNLAVTLKVCQDALVAEQILPDDSWVCVPASSCRIHPPAAGKPAALWLELTDVTEWEEPA